MPLLICKFYLSFSTWNLISNLYYRLWKGYVNNENLSFNKYGVLSFIFFVYRYTLGFYSFIYIFIYIYTHTYNIYTYTYIYIYIYIYVCVYILIYLYK